MIHPPPNPTNLLLHPPTPPKEKPPHHTLQPRVPSNLIQDPKQRTITKTPSTHMQPPPE
ncbi:hypothetical protein L873DRAFT_1821879 [Choiromyces venosus 120613-1]|uniref:Uncharacterized protein n=1 Tax=Choiromyces venosus 120613-1 TaxID=1336337 RepID=A0A3N4IW29_9PEZI|nr:hypothetical protein L873DRAFT_1821879 [Choiromyces venosus 120613-1]